MRDEAQPITSKEPDMSVRRVAGLLSIGFLATTISIGIAYTDLKNGQKEILRGVAANGTAIARQNDLLAIHTTPTPTVIPSR